jgi:phosphate transport system permease protein
LSRHRVDPWLRLGSQAAAVVAALLLLAVAWVVVAGALPGLRAFGPGAFLGDASWQPAAGRVGAGALIAGTMAVTALAMAIALPLGVGVGIAGGWLLPPRPAKLLRLLTLVAAGIPSVVLGLWGLTALVPLLAHWRAPGTSLLAAALVLAVMLAPTIAVVVDAALRGVPAEQRRAAAALGLSRWGALGSAGRQALRSGVLTAMVIATARALGETMAVLLVAGNVAQVPGGITDPVRTLTGGIALEMAYAAGDHRAALFVLGLIALIVVVVLLLLLRRVAADDRHGVGHV